MNQDSLCQEELGREDPYSASVIFTALLSTRIPFVPNRKKVKVPVVKSFNGSDDPIEHIASYRDPIGVNTTCKVMLCKLFPTIVLGLALNWYISLPL